MIKNLIKLLLAASLVAPLPAVANLLQEIYDLALKSDPTYATAQADYAIGREARPQILSRILPQLSANASITQQEDEVTAVNPGGSFSMSGDRFKGDILSANLTLTQPLFDWGVYASLGTIGERLAQVEIAMQGAEQELIVRVVSSYFNWLAAEDSLRFAKAEKSAIGQQHEQARSRFEVGLSAITDVQEAKARFDLAVAQEIQAASQLRSARESMGEIVGEIVFTPVRLGNFPITNPQPANPDIWVTRALEQNLSLRLAQLDSSLRKSALSESYGGHLPSLTLQGNLGLNDRTDFPGGTETESTAVTLRLDVPLFAGGASHSARRQRRGELDRSMSELERARRATVRETRGNYDGVVSGVSTVKALTQAVKSSETALEAVQAGFNVGSRTAVDVLNAQRELYRAQRDLSRARYDYLLSMMTLKQSVGALSAADLESVDSLLEPIAR